MAHWPHLPTETLEFVKQRQRLAGLPTDDATVYAIWKLLPYHRWLAAKQRLIEASPNRDRQNGPTTPDTP
jgi:hypothetical protein